MSGDGWEASAERARQRESSRRRRRLLIPGVLRLSDLHQAIQTAFGWTDSHQHQFEIAGQRFGQPDDFDERFLDEAEVTISHAVGRSVKRFSYMYDFGDDWEHEILVEKVIGGDSGPQRPLCTGGRYCGWE